MNPKIKAIKAQEHILYNELIKYVQLLTVARNEFVEDFEDIAEKQPGFYIVTVVKGAIDPLVFSSHILTPASLRQDSINSLPMTVAASYGVTSIAPNLLTEQFSKFVTEITDITLEIEHMQFGVGRS